MNLRSNNKVKVEGGMASMTDLVFLLLIFFIIMSLMSNDTMTVDVPQNSDSAPEQELKEVSVVITEDNSYLLKFGTDVSDPRDFEDLTPELDALMAETGSATLRIEGHRLADYEAVFKVMAYADLNRWKPALAYKR